MSSLFNTLLRTLILDDSAYREWRERPNLFLRGIVLLALITLVAELVVFGANLAERVRPTDLVAAEIEKGFDRVLDELERFIDGAFFSDMPDDARQTMEEMRDEIRDSMELSRQMTVELAQVNARLPRGVAGFFQAVGAYLSRVLAALGGWMFYGVLVLVVVNLLGGSAKLPHFLGMTALYIVPGLLAILQPIYCVGFILALVGTIWSVVVYIKAVSVASDLDVGTSILAVLAPFIAIVLLAIPVAIAGILWLFVVLS